MSAEHDMGPTRENHRPSVASDTDAGARSDCRDGTATRRGATAQKRRRVARIDRGGPPLEEPTAVQRRIAARECFWSRYDPGPDGEFVWLEPSHDTAPAPAEDG